MNIRFLTWLSSFALTTWLATAATASSIEYTAQVVGAPQIWEGQQPSLSVDLMQGGSYGIGSPALAPIYDGTLAYTRNSVSLDTTALVMFYAQEPGRTDGAVIVTVPIRGSIYGDGFTSDLEGGYTASGVSSQVSNFPGGNLPPPLLDLLSHPERVSLTATVTGGHMSYLTTTLGISPFVDPVPVPEPSVLVTLLLGLGAFGWHRSSRRGNERAGGRASSATWFVLEPMSSRPSSCPTRLLGGPASGRSAGASRQKPKFGVETPDHIPPRTGILRS